MQRLTKEHRTKIVRAAKDWLGTPYHHHARVKGAGADCAMFPLAVYQECGVLPLDFQPPEYSVQWHLHRSEELYLNEIEKFTVEIDAITATWRFCCVSLWADVLPWSHCGGMADCNPLVHSSWRASE
jgi:cell wall-associated NlpC family hydrolase